MSQEIVTKKPVVHVTVNSENEVVILNFNRSVDWVEMDPVTAIKVAEAMKEKAIGILRT